MKGRVKSSTGGSRPRLGSLVAAAGLVVSAPLAVAAVHETAPPFGMPGFEIERVSWSGGVGSGGGVTVLNRFGDVRARFGGYEGRAELFANAQQFADEGARLLVDTRVSATGVQVTVGYRSDETGELRTQPVPGQKKRVDLVVYVPRGAPLSVVTENGLVDLRGLKSDVRVRTDGGGISARKIDGELDVETGSGDVLARLDSWDPERRHSLVSVGGDLTVVLAGEVDAVVQVATSGLISTDYSMTLDYRAGRRPIRRGRAVIGGGSCSVSLSSTDGHIRLSRRPLAREARTAPEKTP